MKAIHFTQLIWLAVLLGGCVTPGSRVTEHNKEIVRRYFDGWVNHGDTRVADELIAFDLVLRNPPTVLEGLTAYKNSMAGFHRAFPDLHFGIEDLIAESDRVVVRWRLTGTHSGEYQGRLPTGKSISVMGTSTFRIAAGKIQEIWVSMDRLGLMSQLGWVPTASPPPQ